MVRNLVIRFGIQFPKAVCNNRCVESVEHYQLQCLNYDRENDTLRKEVGTRRMWTENLSGYPKVIDDSLSSEYVDKAKSFKF